MRTVWNLSVTGDLPVEAARGGFASSATGAPMAAADPTSLLTSPDLYTPMPAFVAGAGAAPPEGDGTPGEGRPTFGLLELRALSPDSLLQSSPGEVVSGFVASSLDELAEAFGVPSAETWVAATENAVEEIQHAQSNKSSDARRLEENPESREHPTLVETNGQIESEAPIAENHSPSGPPEPDRPDSDEPSPELALRNGPRESVAHDETRAEEAAAKPAPADDPAETEPPDETRADETREPAPREQPRPSERPSQTPDATEPRDDVELRVETLQDEPAEAQEEHEELELHDLRDAAERELDALEPLEEELREQERRDAEDQEHRERERDERDDELLALLDEVVEAEAERPDPGEDPGGSPERESNPERDEAPSDPNDPGGASADAEDAEAAAVETIGDDFSVETIDGDAGIALPDPEPDPDPALEAELEPPGGSDGPEELDDTSDAVEGEDGPEVDDEREPEIEPDELDEVEPEEAELEEEPDAREVEGHLVDDAERRSRDEDDDYELPSDRFVISGHRYSAERAAAGHTEPHSYVLEVGHRLAPTSWEAKMDEYPFELRLNIDRSLTGEIRLRDAVETIWLGPDAIGTVRDVRISVRSLEGARLIEDFRGHVIMTPRD